VLQRRQRVVYRRAAIVAIAIAEAASTAEALVTACCSASGLGAADVAAAADEVLPGAAVAETCCDEAAVRLAWLEVEAVVVGLVDAEPSGHSAPEVGVTEK
jgi:hypothetical protein